jgi:molybdate transport system ATP-binding protein
VIECDFAARRGAFELALCFSSAAPILGVFGPSGAGKSTLLDAIAGLVPVESGGIRLGEDVLVDVSSAVCRPARERRVGYVRQFPDLFPHRTVAENLELARRWGQVRSGASRDLARAVQVLEIGPLLARRPESLSGGQARRATLARAIAANPAVLLLDEPLAGLEDPLRHAILPYLAAIQSEFGIPIVLVTHRVEELLGIATETIVIEEGRLVAHGATDELFERPTALEVARLSGFENFLDAEVADSQTKEGITWVHWAGNRLAVPLLARPRGAPVRVALLGEDILLAEGLSGKVSARNVLDVVVRRVRSYGTECIVELDARQGQLRARVTPGAVAELAIQAGTALKAVIKTTALRPVEA